MNRSFAEYNKISTHFSEKTGKHCEFVQDAVTMFLKVETKLFKSQRNDNLSIEEVITIFNRKLESL